MHLYVFILQILRLLLYGYVQDGNPYPEDRQHADLADRIHYVGICGDDTEHRLTVMVVCRVNKSYAGISHSIKSYLSFGRLWILMKRPCPGGHSRVALQTGSYLTKGLALN